MSYNDAWYRCPARMVHTTTRGGEEIFKVLTLPPHHGVRGLGFFSLCENGFIGRLSTFTVRFGIVFECRRVLRVIISIGYIVYISVYIYIYVRHVIYRVLL